MPIGEVAGAVNKGDNTDLLRGDAVHESVAKHKELAEIGLAQLRHDSASVGKGLEARSGFERPDQNLDGLVSRS
jgi:hypothetical protein